MSRSRSAALVHGDAAGREAHAGASAPRIDWNVVGEIVIAVAVRGDAIEGKPVVDAQHPVVLEIQADFDLADGINAQLIAVDELRAQTFAILDLGGAPLR